MIIQPTVRILLMSLTIQAYSNTSADKKDGNGTFWREFYRATSGIYNLVEKSTTPASKYLLEY